MKRDDSRIRRIRIGQEVIKCPFLGVSASLMVVLVRCWFRVWGCGLIVEFSLMDPRFPVGAVASDFNPLGRLEPIDEYTSFSPGVLHSNTSVCGIAKGWLKTLSRRSVIRIPYKMPLFRQQNDGCRMKPCSFLLVRFPERQRHPRRI